MHRASDTAALDLELKQIHIHQLPNPISECHGQLELSSIIVFLSFAVIIDFSADYNFDVSPDDVWL